MIVTDYYGNIVEWIGTASAALGQGLNVDCTRCTDCNGCTRCIDCTRCTDCNDCTRCIDCTRCVDCTRCTDCNGCTGCTRCIDSTRCTDCIDCTRCIDCSDCSLQPLAVLVTDGWIICIRADLTMKIGCQDHSVDRWLSFSNAAISKMDSRALEFWQQWKPVIQKILKGKLS